jgi:hypothetical protein
MATNVQGLELVYAVEELARFSALAGETKNTLREARDLVVRAEVGIGELKKAKFEFLEPLTAEDKIRELKHAVEAFEREIGHVESYPIDCAAEAGQEAHDQLGDLHHTMRERLLASLASGSKPISEMSDDELDALLERAEESSRAIRARLDERRKDRGDG